MEVNNVQDAQYHMLLEAPKIAIIGMPLAGKTTLIRSLDGVDLDEAIEDATAQSIPELLEQGTFREEETKTLSYLVKQECPLIALGGGAILKQENLALLKEYCVVFLDTPLPVLHERLKTNVRPLIKKPADLDDLFLKRYPLYLKAATLQLDGQTLHHLLRAKMGL